MRECLVIEHFIEVLKATVTEIQLHQVLSPPAVQSLPQYFFGQPACEMFFCLLLLNTLNCISVKDLQFFQNKQAVHSVVSISAERVARHVEDDQFLQVFNSIDFLRVHYFVVPKIEFLEASQFGEIFKAGQLVIFQGKLQQIIECVDAFYFCNAIFAKFEFLKVDELREVLDFADPIFLKIEFLHQLAVLNEVNLLDQVVRQVQLPQIDERLNTLHRR